MVHTPEKDATIVVATNGANTAGGGSDPIFIQIVQLLFPERFENVTTAAPASATPDPWRSRPGLLQQREATGCPQS